MIRLEKIKRSGEIISCDAFIEDCETPIRLELNTRSLEFRSGKPPAKYYPSDWHISKARKYLLSLKDSTNIPEKQTLMWY